MTTIDDLFSHYDLRAMLADRYVRRQYHPELPIAILNYTEQTAFERKWNPVTRQCRGLIYHTETREVVARPFEKFFNYGENTGTEDDSDILDLSLDERATVTEKLDGSLGILFDDGDGGAIATRGSFTSEQAKHATALWKSVYAHRFQPDPKMTYLFEIIYPDNRIVCDYSGADDLYLLGAVEIATGYTSGPDETEAFSTWPGPSAAIHPYATLREALAAPPRPGAEGLVVDLTDRGIKIKLKQDDYVALHRVITSCTARRLWEHLAINACLAHGNLTYRLKLGPARIAQITAAGPDWIEPLRENTPPEFRAWVNVRVAEMIDSVECLHGELTCEFKIAREKAGDDRKAFALLVAGSQHAGAMFKLLNNQEIDSYLWLQYRPDHELPYVKGDG